MTIAGLIGTSIGMRRATLARTQADRNAARAGELADEARKAETNALRQAYAATLLSASDALEREQIATVRLHLNNAPANLRGWEWRHLSSRLDPTTRIHERPRSAWSQIHPLPDGRSYYDVGPDPMQGIRRWESDTGRLLETIPAKVPCWQSRLISGRKQMVMQASNEDDGAGTIELWDLEHGNRLWSHPVPGPIVISPDGSQAAYEESQKIHIVDIPSGRTRVSSTMTAVRANNSRAMCFQPDGRRLAVCKSVGEVALLDVDSLEIVSTLERRPSPTWYLAFSADSRLLATGALDGTICITDIAANSPAVVATIRGHTGWSQAAKVCFSPDGALLASCAADRTLRLWDTQTGKSRGVFESDGDCPGFLPDGQTVFNGDTKGVRFWDVRSFDAWVLRGHRSYVYPVVLSPDGATIYSGGWDGYVGQSGCLRFWDAATGDPIAATGPADMYIRAAALSRDGSRLAILVNTAKEPVTDTLGRINILDTATGRTIASIALSSPNSLSPWTDSLALDSTAQNLAWIDFRDGVAYLADARTGVVKKSRRLPGARGITSRVAWSPDDATIAAGYFGEDGGIYLLDPQSLEPLRRWPHRHSGSIFSLGFSPDSRRLLTASQDGIVRVWDVATGAPLHDLVGHANRVLCAVYSPDGQRIASGGGDNSVRLWDANTFEQVGRLGGHEDYVYWVGSSRVDLQACKLEYSIVSPK